jgi:hypothetical protein
MVLMGVLVSAPGCRSGTAPAITSSYGFLTVAANYDSVSYGASPTAVFYTSTALVLPSSRVNQDSCRIISYSVLPPATDTVSFLDAGASLTLAVGGGSVSLPKTTQGSTTSYRIAANGRVTFTPGDSATLTIPGASPGFPATTIAFRTAEAFTRDSVAVPAAGAGIPLVWTPAGDSTSKMVFSLRYASSGSPKLNQQVYCVLRDDGAFTIPVALAGGWRFAYQDRREVAATRWRTRILSTADATVETIATFDVPTPRP